MKHGVSVYGDCNKQMFQIWPLLFKIIREVFYMTIK